MTDDIGTRLARIRDKLPQARAADPDLEAFGARSHRYDLQPAATQDALAQFERERGIALPEGYRRFLREVGNGGAGPFYGLSPLGSGTRDVTGGRVADALRRPGMLVPGMSDDAWEALVDRLGIGLGQQPGIAARREAMATLHGPVIGLGDQGCTYFTGLLVDGPHAGRVVYLDEDCMRTPIFAFEPDFLAWYERWLDEVIAGEVDWPGHGFGCTRGGSAADLLAGFMQATQARTAAEYLEGLAAKPRLHPQIVSVLLRLGLERAACRAQIADVVCKSDFARAAPLLDILRRDSPLDFLKCLQSHAGAALVDWRESLLSPDFPVDRDVTTFAFFARLLARLDVDRGAYLVLHTRSDLAGIRAHAFKGLGQVADKAAYVDCFARGLADEDSKVVFETLRALAGVIDPALVPHYRRLEARFATDRDHVLANLDRRLAEFGLSRGSSSAIEG